MIGFYNEAGAIYRLKVPFERIYTSVFLIDTEEAKILMDCATTAEDVDRYILPALKSFGYDLSEIDAIVISHRHEDHAGGLKRITELAPSIKVITEIRPLPKGLSIYPLPGHTKDCIGILDEGSHTLISVDGIQGEGIDKYRCSLKDPEAYLRTLEKIKNDERIENILFSHAYEPWNEDSCRGRENVLKCIAFCENYSEQKNL